MLHWVECGYDSCAVKVWHWMVGLWWETCDQNFVSLWRCDWRSRDQMENMYLCASWERRGFINYGFYESGVGWLQNLRSNKQTVLISFRIKAEIVADNFSDSWGFDSFCGTSANDVTLGRRTQWKPNADMQIKSGGATPFLCRRIVDNILSTFAEHECHEMAYFRIALLRLEGPSGLNCAV